MPIQKCPLCLETKNVVSSHLMPARMYEYCRPPGGHSISISTDLVIESDRELQDYLLCSGCEDSLNRGGEMWLLPLLSQYKGPFPFYDLLAKFPPDVVDGNTAAYAAVKNPEIHCDKLIHFRWKYFGRQQFTHGVVRELKPLSTWEHTRNQLEDSCAVKRHSPIMQH